MAEAIKRCVRGRARGDQALPTLECGACDAGVASVLLAPVSVLKPADLETLWSVTTHH